MSEKITLTPEEKLAICNMTSTGTKMKDAIARIVDRRNATDGAATDEVKKKVPTKDKKAALAKEIKSLDGEVPAASASVAKFEEALTAAKAAKAAKAAEEKEAAEKEAADEEKNPDSMM